MPDPSYAQTALRSEAQSQLEMQAGKKNIVICCDGTGNEFGDTNSNVVKIYTALEIDNQQVGYYHPGVGTMGDPAERHRMLRRWSQVKGLAFASGFKDNVLDAYRYLMSVCNDGDRVYLFGFSRGAYTVRALAGLLNGYGLLCLGNEGHLPYAWRMYVNEHKKRGLRQIEADDDDAAAFKETFSRKGFEIHFVGIWDTVSSVGWIYTPMRLFNVSQNRTICCGRHAISIDERRCFYEDNLWGPPLQGQNIEQVWFAGAHSDVGGSYKRLESGLSLITLKWMMEEAQAAGLRLVKDRVNLVLGEPSGCYPHAQRLYKPPNNEIEHHSLKGVWWLLELLPHIYYDKGRNKELYRIPLGVPRQLPKGALVHPSVVDRMDDAKATYNPRNVQRGDLKPCSMKPSLFEYSPAKVEMSNTPMRLLTLILFIFVGIIVALVALVIAIHLVPIACRALMWLEQMFLAGFLKFDGWITEGLRRLL